MAPRAPYNKCIVGENSFRILKLEPSSGSSEEITCKLERVDLYPGAKGLAQPYDALSYVWGLPKEKSQEESSDREGPEGEEPTKGKLISCDDTSLLVTNNCFEALHALRQLHQTTWLFVDALCIDQENIKEKEKQVAIMGDIYAGAARVIVWLGPGDNKIDLAFQDFRRLYRLRPMLVDTEGLVKDTTAVRYFRDALYNSKSPLILGRYIPSWNGWRFKNWLEVIDKEYFERVWPLQETALSRQATLICGQATVDFNAARFAIEFMKPYWTEMSSLKYRLGFTRLFEGEGEEMSEQPQSQKASEPARNIEPAGNFGFRHAGYEAHEILRSVVGWGLVSDIWKDQRKWKYIEHALRINADLCATNPVDKVYSLFSLFSRIFEHFPKPNYGRSVQLLWVLTSLSVIESFRTLDLLANMCNDGHCGVHGSELYCTSEECMGISPPRWCYRWEPEPMKAHWKRPFSFFDQKLPRDTLWDREPGIRFQGETLNIETALKSLDELVENNKVTKVSNIDDIGFSIHGKLIARISQTSPKPEFLSSWLSAHAGKDKWHRTDMFIREMTTSLRQWFDLIKTVRPRIQDARRTFYNLMMWERSPEVTSTSVEDFTKWCLLLESSDYAEHISDLTMKALQEINEKDYHVQLCGFEQFRRIFLTDDKKVGKASYAVEVDDLVVLPCWSRMPAILRPVKLGDKVLQGRTLGIGPRYLLIGFAYMDGLMDCKNWRLKEDELVEFCLL